MQEVHVAEAALCESVLTCNIILTPMITDPLEAEAAPLHDHLLRLPRMISGVEVKVEVQGHSNDLFLSIREQTVMVHLFYPLVVE